jgi:tetratricopeptide (TPR) repeat protein
VDEQKNPSVKAGSRRAALSVCADDDLVAVGPPAATSISGRGRLRIGVTSFAAGGSERSENLAFVLGHEITTALGRLRCFDVIAGMSPNAAVPICVVREHQFRRMDLDYLVDLTLSENGQHTEVNVRLLDLSAHARAIWSRRLDLTDGGIHPIDELVAMQVAGCIGPVTPLVQGDSQRRSRYGAIGFLRRALPLMFSMERDKFQQAGQLIKFAREVDPDDEEIAAWAVRWQYFNIILGYAPHSRQEFGKVRDLAQRTMKSSPDNAEAVGVYAHYCAFLEKDFDSALEYFDRSLRLNPSHAFIWGLSGPTYCYIGEPKAALQRMDRFRELAPFDPYTSCFESLYALAYLFDEDYERATIVGRRAVEVLPSFVNGYKPLIAALGHLDRREEAKSYLDRLLRLEPGFTVEDFGEVYPIKKAADRRRYMEGLRLAGVPAG